MSQSLETLTDDEDDGPLVAAAAPPPPPPPPPPPSIPIGSTKFPARNIELVHPAPGRRFLSLRAQPQPVQDVFEPALENLACEIYGVDAFPDRRTRADMKVGALLAALRGMSHHDIETRIWNDPVYTRLFGSLVCSFVSVLMDLLLTTLSLTARAPNPSHAILCSRHRG